MKTITALVDADEWYPVYSIRLPVKDGYSGGRSVQISEDEFDEIQRAFVAFEAVQARLQNMIKTANQSP